ncbi:hypothetical protein MPTK1_2g00880 [Marchantia polymorpha subsp. ruderalis]|uniref:Uncharacterized protein n=1 Tax=Marchantia polymorpha TaxID=3197 RepID=A0A2R6X9G1_MARPO|nr:hypothetical protein MARPO_0028s0063 [Marchantia polymorpha]BBN00649.1 hypothetical protein Mp_2g00880 [Marchantia polymorpha subsp. ruderalis]|eukprot:PTQ42747.1 hypothetical protein MARPO_0028s0063 [Marchantia polymorpha]
MVSGILKTRVLSFVGRLAGRPATQSWNSVGSSVSESCSNCHGLMLFQAQQRVCLVCPLPSEAFVDHSIFRPWFPAPIDIPCP